MNEFEESSHSLEVFPKNLIIQTKMVPIRESLSSFQTKKGVIVPDFKAPSVKEVDFNYLYNKYGVRTAFIDVDNTLTPVGKNIADKDTIKYLLEAQNTGVLSDIYLATRSNRNLSWLEEAIHAKRFRPSGGEKKSDVKYFWSFLNSTNCSPKEIVMIGDRLTHDIKGAEEAGLVTVWVDPIRKGYIKGWIPTDFLGTYQREQKAIRMLQQELR
jgi:predicted HAD superfamily phosphohydrolase YqeG